MIFLPSRNWGQDELINKEQDAIFNYLGTSALSSCLTWATIGDTFFCLRKEAQQPNKEELLTMFLLLFAFWTPLLSNQTTMTPGIGKKEVGFFAY